MNRRLSGSVSRGSRKPLRMAKFVVPLTLFYIFHNRVSISDRISVSQKPHEMQHVTMPSIVFKSFRMNSTDPGDFKRYEPNSGRISGQDSGIKFGPKSGQISGLKPEQVSTRLKRSIKASKKRKRTGKWWILRRKTRKSAKNKKNRNRNKKISKNNKKNTKNMPDLSGHDPKSNQNRDAKPSNTNSNTNYDSEQLAPRVKTSMSQVTSWDELFPESHIAFWSGWTYNKDCYSTFKSLYPMLKFGHFWTFSEPYQKFKKFIFLQNFIMKNKKMTRSR